ncbi:MAG: DNA mismatch repair protein MutS, partial [bacterium]|nr:DNA mismatch repair protein MutS [bacterium]
PRPVIIRAREILSNLESMELTPDQKPALARHAGRRKTPPPLQVSLFADLQKIQEPDPVAEEIKGRLKEIDPDNITPIEALKLLAELKGRIEGNDVRGENA